MRRVAIVGAGLAGMAAAYEAARTPALDFTLYEASPRLGGTVETLTIPSAEGSPFVVEGGPDSWVTEKTAARALAIELGLEHELISSNDAQRRTYLALGNTLTPMPDGMRMMVPTRWAPVMDSPLFSWQARLAYLREPRRAEELKASALVHPDRPDADESVATFIRRHFGEEATRTIAGPLLAGVFGGDIETLSARAVLAPFVKLEQEHGSLVTAVMARAQAQQARDGVVQPVFTTLRSGLGTLIDRMAATFPSTSIALETPVHAIGRRGGQWRLTTARGEASFDAVLLATPAHVTRALLAPLDPQAAALLAMEASSAIVVALCYQPSVAKRLRIPRGFGFLVPPSEVLSAEASLLAGTFMDQKFPSRAPEGGVFLRGFFGGLAAPKMMHWADEEIVAAARTHFSRYLGPLPAASFSLVRHWPLSLPQYAVGHLARMRTLQNHVDGMPGLALIGNAYNGVGLPNLVEDGRAAVRRLVERP